MAPKRDQASRARQERESSDALEIDLKEPWLAATLAWLVPGLGHLYQGRTGKGLLFAICILGTFFYGFYLGEGRVVYASTPNLLSRWQYFCQLGVGLPAVPAILQRGRVKLDPSTPDTWQDFMRPPVTHPSHGGPFISEDESGNIVEHPDELAQWHHDIGDRFELGTVFTVIAGLLNILVIYDAYSGPLIVPGDPAKPQDEPDEADAGSKD